MDRRIKQSKMRTGGTCFYSIATKHNQPMNANYDRKKNAFPGSKDQMSVSTIRGKYTGLLA